jgi:hypothetical protein
MVFSKIFNGPKAGLKIQRHTTPTTTIDNTWGKNKPALKNAIPGNILRPNKLAKTNPTRMGIKQ